MFPCWLLAFVASFVLYCLMEQNELNQIINDLGYYLLQTRLTNFGGPEQKLLYCALFIVNILLINLIIHISSFN